MTSRKLCLSLVNFFQKRNKPVVRNFLRLGFGIGTVSLTFLPYEVKDNRVVANVNGVLRFLRFVHQKNLDALSITTCKYYNLVVMVNRSS